ncbi:MAG TPA: hypothetical protein VIY47_02780 [Ignavibacteriaceae bacterium]
MIELESLYIDLEDRSSDNIISEKLTKLKNSGHHKFSLNIKSSSEKEIQKLDVNIDLFTRIKEKQDLPDWVIIKLILAERKLIGSKFSEKIQSG